MCINGGDNILPFELSSNEIGRAVELDPAVRVDFSDKRDLSPCNGEGKVALGILEGVECKPSRQVPEGVPATISEYSREASAVLLLRKASVGLLIVIVSQKALARSLKGRKGRAFMPSEYPLLPESIKTLDGSVSSWLSLWDEHHMDAQKQVESDNLGDAVRVTPASCGSHFIVQLGGCRNSQRFPGVDQVSAQRDRLFIRILARRGCVASHINGVEGIESGNAVRASEVSGTHEVCLMEVSHILCFAIRVWLGVVLSFRLISFRLSMTGETSLNGRDGRNPTNSSLLKLPMDNFCTNAGEGRTIGLVRLQLVADGEEFLDHMRWSLSPEPFWNTGAVFKPFKAVFVIPPEPLEEPAFAPLHQLKNLIKANMFMIKLYRLTAFLIFILILHRLLLLPNIFGRSLGDLKLSSRSYEGF